MAKVVHFTPSNFSYISLPPTLSPSNSDDSPHSSPSPPTPPGLDQRGGGGYADRADPSTPICQTQFPELSKLDLADTDGSDGVQLHRSLAFQPTDDHDVRYDFSLPFHEMIRRLNAGVLGDLATEPAGTKFRIVYPPLGWEIPVFPSMASADGCITVLDVLAHLYDHLHCPVSDSEYRALSWTDSLKVRAAYDERCAQVPLLARRAAAKVEFRKIDLLMGQKFFEGLYVTSEGPPVWELAVAF